MNPVTPRIRITTRIMTRIAPALALALILALPAAAQEGAENGRAFHGQRLDPEVELPWNRLRDFEELEDAMRRMADAYEFCTLTSIGESSQGRDLWLMTINNPATGAHDAKPAMWIDGNIHGNEVQAADVCLYTIWYLMEYYGHVERITRLVDERAFYILPSLNPDGRAAWFREANTAHSCRSGQRPTDNDRDGELDEDGYDDLDGNGDITQMRKRMPGEGDMIPHPDDPRLMVRAASGQKGDYVMLGWEGIDNDGDGHINEDPPGGYDMNRNWPSDWQPEYLQYGAGEYPLCFPETRAVADFVLAHPNIAAFQSYHNAGGMILRGPGHESMKGAYPRADLRVYEAIGERGEEMMPHYRYLVVHEDLYGVRGGEVTWASEMLGIIAFTNELWTPAQLSGKTMTRRERRSQGRFQRMASQLDRMELVDRVLLGEPHADWTTVEHPTHGTVEVGGYRRMYGRVPPPWMLEELLHRNTAFTLYHAEEMPRLDLDEPTATPLDSTRDTWRIDAVVHNTRLIPTRTARANQKRIGRRDFFEIAGVAGARGSGDNGLENGDGPDGDAGSEVVSVLASGALAGRLDARFVPRERAHRRIWNDGGLGSHSRLAVRWIVAAPAGTRVVVAYDAEKGGRVERTLTLGE